LGATDEEIENKLIKMKFIGKWMTLKTMFKGSSKNTYAVGSIGDLKKGGDRDKPVKDQVNAIFKEKGFE
jgi:hypothetical protein